METEHHLGYIHDTGGLSCFRGKSVNQSREILKRISVNDVQTWCTSFDGVGSCVRYDARLKGQMYNACLRTLVSTGTACDVWRLNSFFLGWICYTLQQGSGISHHIIRKLHLSRKTCDERCFIMRVCRAIADASSTAMMRRGVSTSMRGRTWHIYNLSSRLRDACSMSCQYQCVVLSVVGQPSLF